ncbi:MAG: FG-GAP-like repeat-containing protein [Candidatus Korobacteraceae bacterium]|jgi:hypothetical protein
MSAAGKFVRLGSSLHLGKDLVYWAIFSFAILFFPSSARAQGDPTLTTLTVFPNQVSAGQVVTLTAAVTIEGDLVTVGTVTFSVGRQVLGTVQLVQFGQAAGTATLKTRFAPGTFTPIAHYNGTNFFQPSASQPQQLNVTGTEPTISTLSAQPDGNNYDFTASVFGFGFPAPTGTATFNDLTTMTSLGSAGIAGPGVSTFLPQQTYVVGNVPAGVAVSDFNGDGFPDLAVTNQNDSTISVLLGKGDGTFQPQQTYPVGLNPNGVVVADFNGDGFPDLVVANFVNDNTVSVLLGKGDGTFQPQQKYPVGDSPVGVVVADFNGDGIADLAVTNEYDNNTVSVLLGNGDGTFQPQQTYPVGVQPIGIAVGDFNGDGVADLAVANFVDGTVSVLLGKGDGTFQPQQTYPVGNLPVGVAVGVFNGHGIADIAVTNAKDNTVGVLLGKGDGTFQPQQTYPVGKFPTLVVVADFNGDGILDLAVTNGNDNTVGVLLGKGDGTFQPQQTYPVGNFPFPIAVADFNGDDVPDLAISNYGMGAGNTVSILLGGTVATGQLLDVPVFGVGVHNIQSTYTQNINFYAGSLSNVVPVPGRQMGDFAVAITPGNATVTQGYNNANDPFFAQAINLSVQPINGYNGVVSLSCSVNPPLAGGSCVVNPPSSGLVDGNLNTTLSISAGLSTPIGCYNVTVTGQDNSGLMHFSAAALMVINNAPGITMPPGGANRTPVSFGCSSGGTLRNPSCPLVSGTGISGSEDFSKIGGVCTFNPVTTPLPGTTMATISGCTVARLRAGTRFYATLWLGMPAVFLLGSLRIRKLPRKKVLQLVVALLLLLALLTGVSCGGGSGQLTPTGNYLVLVQGTGSDGVVYSAVVPVTVTASSR